MLSLHPGDLVLWIHILAACVWIGGQVVIAMLVPVLRGSPLLAVAARRYQWAAWSAYAILLLTGLLNARNVGIGWSDLGTTALGRTLLVKLAFVLLSGIAAAVHAFLLAPRAGSRSTARSRALSGVLGVLSLVAAIVAALYGVIIAGAS